MRDRPMQVESMNDRTMVLHGSEVAAIEVRPGAVVVRFAVACVRRATDRPGGAEEGYLSGLRLVCDGATVSQHDEGCVGRLADGSLGAAGASMGRLPLPCEVEGDIRLELLFANGARFRLAARRVALRAADGSTVFEDYSC